jgi:acyl carrier protein
MTNEQALENRVRAQIVEMFLTEAQAETLQSDTDLLGVLDSLQILRLVLDLEAQFGVKIADSDLTLENFSSVARIAAFIGRKLDALEQSVEVQVAKVP